MAHINILEMGGWEWRNADDTKRQQTIDSLNDKTKMIGNHRSEFAYHILLIHTTQDNYRKQLFEMVLEDSEWSWKCLTTCFCTISEYRQVLNLHKYPLLKRHNYLQVMETFDCLVTDYVKQDLVNIIIEQQDYELAKRVLTFLKTIPFPQVDITRLEALLVSERLLKAK